MPRNASDAVEKNAIRKNRAKNSSVSGRLNQYASSNLKTVENIDQASASADGADAMHVHVLEQRLDRRESVAGRGLTVDVHDRIAGDESDGDHLEARLNVGQLRFANAFPPDMSANVVEHLRRIALKDHLAAADDRHPAAELADVLDDVRRENDDDVLADLAQQIEKPVPLVGIEARGRLVDDEQLRVDRRARSRCRAAASCRRRIRRRSSCARPRDWSAAAARDELAPLAGDATPFSAAK